MLHPPKNPISYFLFTVPTRFHPFSSPIHIIYLPQLLTLYILSHDSATQHDLLAQPTHHNKHLQKTCIPLNLLHKLNRNSLLKAIFYSSVSSSIRLWSVSGRITAYKRPQVSPFITHPPSTISLLISPSLCSYSIQLHPL